MIKLNRIASRVIDGRTYRFAQEKSDKLRRVRNFDFYDVIDAVANNQVLDDYQHSNRARYPKQRIMVVRIKRKIYAVPYVKEQGGVFLKTAYPSTKLTRVYEEKKRSQPR